MMKRDVSRGRREGADRLEVENVRQVELQGGDRRFGGGRREISNVAEQGRREILTVSHLGQCPGRVRDCKRQRTSRSFCQPKPSARQAAPTRAPLVSFAVRRLRPFNFLCRCLL